MVHIQRFPQYCWQDQKTRVNDHVDDSEKQFINVICITMYKSTFGNEVEFMGLKISEPRSGNNLYLDQYLKT